MTIKISKNQKIKARRKVMRDIDIELGGINNRHIVFKNKKAYNRKRDRKISFNY